MASIDDGYQEKDKIKEMHQLTDTTFRNTEELMLDMNGIVEAAERYRKSLKDVRDAGDRFFSALLPLGAKASKLPGAVRKLGDTILEMVASHKSVKFDQDNWIESLKTDFIIPMKMKLKTGKEIAIEHKEHRVDYSRKLSKVKKAQKVMDRDLKKRNLSHSQVEKRLQLKHLLADHIDELHSTCTEGLRKALIDERKLYCFMIDHFCTTLHNQISYNSSSHQVMSSQVNTWSSLCSSPNELLPESAVLLHDPRSPGAFPPSTLAITGSPIELKPKHREHKTVEGPGPAAMKERRTSCRVRALYPHNQDSPGRLEFRAGDLIDAIDDPCEGWQFGKNTRTGSLGWFPVDYVHKMWPPENPDPMQRRGKSDIGIMHVPTDPTSPKESTQDLSPHPSSRRPSRSNSELSALVPYDN